MTTPYDRGFRKITQLDALPVDAPKLFRTGGASIVLLRSRFGVRAIDAAPYVSATRVPDDLSDALNGPVVPAEIHDGAVWVCVDLCTRE